MCGEVWSWWAVACYVLTGICLGFGWFFGNLLAARIAAAIGSQR